jgi:carbonic anhydrase
MQMSKKTVICASIIIVILIAIFANRMFFSNELRDRLSETTAKALVLSCIDFRFVNDRASFFNMGVYQDNYNKFSLAGASLGYNQNTFPEWRETCNKHIELAQQLHDIDEVIVLDHMDCGAYRILYDNPTMSKQEEYTLHKKNLKKFKSMINEKFPSLKVTTLLMDVDGSVMQ